MLKCLLRQMLQFLHESHWGITRMKQMVWWPNINNYIEKLVQRCDVLPPNCESTRRKVSAMAQNRKAVGTNSFGLRRPVSWQDVADLC